MFLLFLASVWWVLDWSWKSFAAVAVLYVILSE